MLDSDEEEEEEEEKEGDKDDAKSVVTVGSADLDRRSMLSLVDSSHVYAHCCHLEQEPEL